MINNAYFPEHHCWLVPVMETSLFSLTYEVNLYTQFTETSVVNSSVQSGSREAVCQALCLLAVSIIPPVLQTYLHLDAPLTRRINGNNLVTFKKAQKSNVLLHIREQWTERSFHFFFSVLAVSYRWPVLEYGTVHVRLTAGKLALRYFLFPTKYFGLSLSLSLHQCSIHICALRTALKRRALQHKWCFFCKSGAWIQNSVVIVFPPLSSQYNRNSLFWNCLH